MAIEGGAGGQATERAVLLASDGTGSQLSIVGGRCTIAIMHAMTISMDAREERRKNLSTDSLNDRLAVLFLAI